MILSYFLMLSLISFIMLAASRKFSFFFFQDKEKTSEYECGFEPFDSATRQPFDIHFYIVGILFLLFDVEIAMLFPWASNVFFLTLTSFWNAIVFILLLFLGLFYEWKLGVLNWPYEDF